MKDKTYHAWIGKRVRRKVDDKLGRAIKPGGYSTWWIVEWDDGSRSPTPQRDMEIIPDA